MPLYYLFVHKTHEAITTDITNIQINAPHPVKASISIVGKEVLLLTQNHLRYCIIYNKYIS